MQNKRPNKVVKHRSASLHWTEFKLYLGTMKKLLFICSILVTLPSMADNVISMGCEWQIPQGMSQKNESVWMREVGHNALIYFDSGIFDPSVIEISITPSVRERKQSGIKVFGRYKLTEYSDYVKSSGELLGIEWVTIENNNGSDGVIYMSGLSLEEIQGFVGTCEDFPGKI